MNIETLIYAYLAICTAMIVFNLVCIWFFRYRDKALKHNSVKLTDAVREQLGVLQRGGTVTEQHEQFLCKKMGWIRKLMAFDETLEELLQEMPEETWHYLEVIRPVFVQIAVENHYQNSMQLAYFAYGIQKYHILEGKPEPVLVEMMMNLLEEPSVYCRENALQAIYSTGESGCVLRALRKLEESGYFHHGKLLTDGLLHFSGDQQRLMQLLWENFESFSAAMQVVILDYIRFGGGKMQDQLLTLLADEDRDDELRLSCIRYFGKYPDQRVYPFLLEFLIHAEEHRWEYAAVSATALGAYPGERTVVALKRAMSHTNWYVRFNASKSLEAFHLTYQDLSDVMDSGDRYAREILQYRLDIRQVQEEEGAVTV